MDREKERTALYHEGMALGESGRWQEAVEKFRQVLAIRSAPPAVFTLAQAEEHLGHLTIAADTYEKARADAVAAGNREVAAAAQSAIASLDPRFPRVVVRLAASSRGATFPEAACAIDGVSVAFDVPSKVDPGEHTVVVRAPRARPFEHRLSVVEGQRVDVVATLEPDADAATPPAPPAPPAPSAAVPVGPIVLGGVGLAAGVVGYLVRAGGQSDYDTASASCPGGRCASQAAVDDGNAARATMLTGTIVMAAGGAAALGAGLWWLLFPSVPSSSGARLGVSASGWGDGAQATVRGRF